MWSRDSGNEVHNGRWFLRPNLCARAAARVRTVGAAHLSGFGGVRRVAAALPARRKRRRAVAGRGQPRMTAAAGLDRTLRRAYRVHVNPHQHSVVGLGCVFAARVATGARLRHRGDFGRMLQRPAGWPGPGHLAGANSSPVTPSVTISAIVPSRLAMTGKPRRERLDDGQAHPLVPFGWHDEHRRAASSARTSRRATAVRAIRRSGSGGVGRHQRPWPAIFSSGGLSHPAERVEQGRQALLLARAGPRTAHSRPAPSPCPGRRAGSSASRNPVGRPPALDELVLGELGYGR